MTTNENDSSVTGELVIEDNVIERIAALAAADVEGVHSLGRSGIAGTIDSVRGGGVSSEHGQREAAFDFDLVVVWGHNIPNVVDAVRSNVLAEDSECAVDDVIHSWVNEVRCLGCQDEAVGATLCDQVPRRSSR